MGDTVYFRRIYFMFSVIETIKSKGVLDVMVAPSCKQLFGRLCFLLIVWIRLTSNTGE